MTSENGCPLNTFAWPLRRFASWPYDSRNTPITLPRNRLDVLRILLVVAEGASEIGDALIDGVGCDDDVGPGALLDLSLRKNFAGFRGEQFEDLHVLRVDFDDVFAARDAVQ